MPPQDFKCMSVAEVAEILDVSPETVLRWIRTGELNAINASRNPKSKKPRLRIRASDLQAFMDLRSTQKVAPVPPRFTRRHRRPDLPYEEIIK